MGIVGKQSLQNWFIMHLLISNNFLQRIEGTSIRTFIGEDLEIHPMCCNLFWGKKLVVLLPGGSLGCKFDQEPD